MIRCSSYEPAFLLMFCVEKAILTGKIFILSARFKCRIIRTSQNRTKLNVFKCNKIETYRTYAQVIK